MARGQWNGWYKPVEWVNIPHTRTERRWAMDVRESSHTAMVHPRRYQNIDTGRFDVDRMQSIPACSLAQLINDHDDPHYAGYPESRLAQARNDFYDAQIKKAAPHKGGVRDVDWDLKITQLVKAKAKEKPKPKATKKPILKVIEKPYLEPFKTRKEYDKWQEEQNRQEKISLAKRLQKAYEEDEARRKEALIEKHWIYHPDFTAKIVTGDEYETYLNDGWYDTPAKFPKKQA